MLRLLLPVIARAPLVFVATLLFARFADEWFTFLPAGTLEPVRADLGLTYAQGGVLLSALGSGGLIGHGFTVAADYVNRRWLAGFGALGYGLCMLLFASADSFLVLVLASVAWGAASDAFVHGLEVALVDAAGEDLAPALGRMNALASVGDLLGPLMLAGAALAGVGWRTLFATGGLLMVAYAALIMAQRFPPPQPPEEARTPWRGVLAVARDRRVLLLAMVDGLYGLLDEPLLAFVIAYLIAARGLSAEVATLVAGLTVTGGIAGFLLTAPLTRRFAPRPLLIALAVVVGLTLAGLVFLPVTAAQAAAGLGLGLFGAAFYGVLQVEVYTLRPGQAGSTNAVVSTIGLAGLAFPPLVGAVADRAGLLAGLALYAAVPVVILALLLAGRWQRQAAATTPEDRG